MSMLSERKRKTKWVINPTKKPLWTTDSCGIKFGKELMEKMGWSAGKGLGVNEQGIQEPLKVSYKNDTKGMGFKGNDDDWIEQQDEFNELLNQLRNDNTSTINISEEEKVVKSLEEKSKQSRARVHYQKFTRGKDLSRYSDHDLACILGINKTKKEKSKTEKIIQIESKVTGNCETSFGVTTINSGSIQDYFKKKWIIDKKSDNLSNKMEDAVKISSKNYKKEGSCFVKSEQSLASENEEEKFKKKKHELGFSECFNLNGYKTSNLGGLESFENNIKRKRKREFQEINLGEVKIERKKKNYDDSNELATENLQKNKNHLLDVLNYEESKNLVNEVDSYNSVKIRKKGKTDLKLDDIKNDKNYEDVADNERKINHENNCVPEIFFTKKLNKTEVEDFILEEEITVCSKKKKSKKEKLKEKTQVSKLESKFEDCHISVVPLKHQSNGEVTEFGLELGSIKKKKEKYKYLKNKHIESKDCSNHENESFDNRGEKKIKVASEEKVNGIIGGNDTVDMPTIKKRKKKKYKKEKLEKEEESIFCHTKSTEKSELEEEFREKNISTNKQENASKIQSFVKKRKKKDTAEKLHEKEKADLEFSCDDVDKSILEETHKETSNSEVIFSTVKQENIVEGESNPKKKKKKVKKENKKERNTDDINYCNDPNVKVQMQESSLELELLKKKKKKDKREKTKMELSCDHTEKPILEESSKETNIYNLNTDSIKTESVEKKKSKKDEKEKSVENKLIEDKEILESLAHSVAENKAKVQRREKISQAQRKEKPNSEIIDRKVELSNNNKTSEFHAIVNNEVEEGTGVHKHKIELLNEKRADKFYPGQHTNDRVLRLIYWSNIAGFKGSNLESLTGYGFLTKCDTNG